MIKDGKKDDAEELRKVEAAKYVGCSVRSLENYAKQGRIGVKYEKSKTRPIALYARDELDRLKAELASTLYAPAVAPNVAPASPEPRDALIRQPLDPAQDLALFLTRLFEAAQEQAGKEREPSILELAQMPLLKLKEAQRYANLSRAELLAAIEADELKASKAGGEWRIRRAALEEYIQKHF
jgi:excisionase family DNA binding protein